MRHGPADLYDGGVGGAQPTANGGNYKGAPKKGDHPMRSYLRSAANALKVLPVLAAVLALSLLPVAPPAGAASLSDPEASAVQYLPLPRPNPWPYPCPIIIIRCFPY